MLCLINYIPFDRVDCFTCINEIIMYLVSLLVYGFHVLKYLCFVIFPICEVKMDTKKVVGFYVFQLFQFLIQYDFDWFLFYSSFRVLVRNEIIIVFSFMFNQ